LTFQPQGQYMPRFCCGLYVF